MGIALPRLSRKRRNSRSDVSVLEPYSRPGYWQRHRRVGLFILGFLAFFYGAFFGITTIYFVMQLAVPLIILALLVIWLLPETGKASIKIIEWLFFAFIIALLFWPNYMALGLPGLPWITAVRLIVIPLAVIFLISLSQSHSFRSQLAKVLNSAPLIWKLVVAYTLISLSSVFISTDPSGSLRGFVMVILNWVLIFFIAACVLSQAGMVKKFYYTVWYAVIFVCLIAVWENRLGEVPWAGHIPSFLKIDNPLIQSILSGNSRYGVYRVQSKFTTPLSLAEFISCSLPFIFYIIVYSRKFAVKVIAAVTVLLVFFVIYKTDARLGVIGSLCSLVLFPSLIGLGKWKTDKASLFAPAILTGIPAAGALLFISSFFIGRIRKSIWGSGMQSYSTQARYDQISLGIPKILSHPWGYGLDQGAVALGYRLESGLLTIDNYYLMLALDIGILGLLVYIAIFLVAVIKSLYLLIKSNHFDDDIILIGVNAICLVQFIIIKSVLSQVETHSFFFAVLGGSVGLFSRVAAKGVDVSSSHNSGSRSMARFDQLKGPHGSSEAFVKETRLVRPN